METGHVKKPPRERVTKPVAKLSAAPQRRPTVTGPTAKTCPLVLDGEVAASDFSESDCLTCSEFDCRFCESRHGSGSMRSRLFAVGEEGEEDCGEEGSDLDFCEGEEGRESEEGEEEGEEDDLF